MRLLLLALLAAPLVQAQQSDVFIQQAEQALGSSAAALAGTRDAGVALSEAVLDAGASANVAAVSQTGTDNVVDLTQRGTGNRFGLVTVGSGNVVGLAQLGNDNVFLGDVLGSGNVLGPDAAGNPSVQAGDGNRYTLFLDGVDGQAHTLRQFGDANEAVQVVGAGMEPASITQTGGASVVVERR